MQLAARSYLAAGVALVGASAIAVSPMAPPVPEAHMPVALTAAIENPLTVFEPAIAATQTLFSNFIERQTTNPLPVLRQLATNVATGVQVFANTDPVLVVALALTHGVITAQEIGPNLAALGESTSSAMNALVENLGVLAAGLPDALQAAGALIAAGDPNGAINAIMGPGVQPIINIMLETVNPQINAVGHVLGVPQPVIDAATESTLGLLVAVASATVGIGFDLPGYPLPLVKQVIAGTQSVLAAAASGDPGTFVNAVQHSVADLAADVAYQVDQTISMGNYIADSFANALKQITPKPVPFPDIELPKALVAPAPAIAATTAVTTALEPVTTPAEKVESAPVTEADNPSGTGTDTSTAPATDGTDADAKADTGTSAADNDGVTKLSTKASPKAAKGQAKANSTKAVRDQVKSTVKKLTDGLKKDKPSTPKKAESSNDSAKGADSK
ncbi:hypothetical protein H5U98_07985 [Mycolicibacterium boenickei]|uniref:PE-PGRS family protein n=1 Tax=Mycolicibacterium boenickei TaxID=146017 RepID=A0AAX3A2C2_9MYCO|nr:hypothetical protein [Mycolicibacterium boenickei]UNC01313.1 hypothetical protein H5U98_07985 [Mycolicibacterium boenickei]BBX91180.1 hypothetical protein MBOE_28290 [Mycolicibacterium boenickei]